MNTTNTDPRSETTATNTDARSEATAAGPSALYVGFTATTDTDGDSVFWLRAVPTRTEALRALDDGPFASLVRALMGNVVCEARSRRKAEFLVTVPLSQPTPEGNLICAFACGVARVSAIQYRLHAEYRAKGLALSSDSELRERMRRIEHPDLPPGVTAYTIPARDCRTGALVDEPPRFFRNAWFPEPNLPTDVVTLDRGLTIYGRHEPSPYSADAAIEREAWRCGRHFLARCFSGAPCMFVGDSVGAAGSYLWA